MINVLIVGAGIAGLSLARRLTQLQIPFTIIERSAAHSPSAAGVALAGNATHILEKYLGLGEEIRHMHHVDEVIYAKSNGNVLGQASLHESPLGAYQFVALTRERFHTILSRGIDNIYFNTIVTELEQTPEYVEVTFSNPDLGRQKFDLVVGADGVDSDIREFVFGGGHLVDLGSTNWRWLCNYPTKGMQPIYQLGKRTLFMTYPISEQQVYCYAHVHDPDQEVYSSVSDHHAFLRQRFDDYHGLAQKMLAPNVLPRSADIIMGRQRSVAEPLFSRGRVALLGDAGTACSPVLQQGVSSALESMLALTELLRHFPVPEALMHYEEVRKERVSWTMKASDEPMKKALCTYPSMFARDTLIMLKGPLNVQGWRELLARDFYADLQRYIKIQKNPGMQLQQRVLGEPLHAVG